MKILLFLLPVITELLHDGLQINNNINPNKVVGVIIRTIVALAVTAYIIWSTNILILGWVTAILVCAIIGWGFHFSFFNYTLNKFTGKTLLHLGNGPWDRFEKHTFPWTIWMAIRVIVLGSVIAMYFLSLPFYGIGPL